MRGLTTALLLLWLAARPAAAAAAQWITHPAASAAERAAPIALQFRRELVLRAVPARAVVRVSADNRYALFVNGRRVALGPARGDLRHWRYRALDLAPFLRRGKNVVAAQVWNDGAAAALAQISARTGFFLEAADGGAAELDSGPRWQVRVDRSRSILAGAEQLAGPLESRKYYAAAPAETHDAALGAPDWLSPVSRAPDWVAAVGAVAAGEAAPWTLVEDRLPAMRLERRSGGRLVGVDGAAGSTFPHRPVTVPPNSSARFLIDAGRLEAAYPELTVSGGRGAEISLSYSEALYGPDKSYLRDRGAVTGGDLLGLTDSFRPDGSRKAVFRPFWWRSWRLAELRVKTGAEPLRLERFTRDLTGYPFPLLGRFESSDPELNRIWAIGWDTVRLDAHETFMDTAYWEQLQYIGDSRLEALISYAVSGDPRLAVQALEAFDDSRTGGLPQSRWPSSLDQSIPPFALLWIGMLHDYWRYQPDPAPLRRSLTGLRAVLDWYRAYVGKDGLVGTTPGWEFIDWRPTLNNYPETTDPRTSEPCIMTLMYVGALRQAAEIEDAVGGADRALGNRTAASRLAQAVQERCWSPTRGLYADTPEKATFSQHANALALLYDVAPEAERRGIVDRITVRDGGIAAPEGITGTTYYFAFYLVRALDHVGLGDRYIALLRTWRAMLAQNFTTWPEQPDPSRSDSHAWSAHPTADLLAIVAGIQPASPGFASVRIAPHLGTLTRLDAASAHPLGAIEVRYRRSAGRLRAIVRLPAGLAGEFQWGGRRIALHPGSNRLVLTEAPGD